MSLQFNPPLKIYGQFMGCLHFLGLNLTIYYATSVVFNADAFAWFRVVSVGGHVAYCCFPG